MKLVVGLGNPGKEYENTRHNVGFRVLDALRSKLLMDDWKYEKKFEAEISEDKERGIVLMKPQAFMNLSGKVVRAYVQFYKIDTSEVVVIYDDVDLNFGDLRFRESGSSAGQKGMQDIMDLLGTKEIARLRIGIGHENKTIPTETFVLQKFTDEEEEALDGIFEQALAAIEDELQ